MDGNVEEDESFVQLACLNYAESGSRPADRIAKAHRLLATDATLASGSIEALATVGDHRALAEMLDAQPEAVNAPCGPNQWPPLLYATYSRIQTNNPDWSAVEMVKVLLDRGADPNAANKTGFTPLHEAARLGSPKVAELLLLAGARVDARDDSGKRPIDYVASHGDAAKVRALLRKHGGK